MGCCLLSRPHSNCRTAAEIQKVLDEEEKFLQKMIDANTGNEIGKIDYTRSLYMIKSSLTQLHLKIEENKDIINKNKDEMNKIKELLDEYCEVKDKQFRDPEIPMESNNINGENKGKLDKSNIDKSANRSVNTPYPRKNGINKAFLDRLDHYLGYTTDED
jgi:hypothetical protein